MEEKPAEGGAELEAFPTKAAAQAGQMCLQARRQDPSVRYQGITGLLPREDSGSVDRYRAVPPIVVEICAVVRAVPAITTKRRIQLQRGNAGTTTTCRNGCCRE
jgi:hypothetical protein